MRAFSVILVLTFLILTYVTINIVPLFSHIFTDLGVPLPGAAKLLIHLPKPLSLTFGTMLIWFCLVKYLRMVRQRKRSGFFLLLLIAIWSRLLYSALVVR